MPSRQTLQCLQTDIDRNLSGSESPTSTTSTSTLSSFSSFTSSSTASIAQPSCSLEPPGLNVPRLVSASNRNQSPKHASSPLPTASHGASPSPSSATPSRSHRTTPAAPGVPNETHTIVAGSARASRKHTSKPYDRSEKGVVASAKKATQGRSAPDGASDYQSASKKETFEDRIERLTGHRPRSFTTPPPPHVREAARARRMCWDASNDFAAQYSTLPLCPGPLETSPEDGDEWLTSDVYHLL